MVDYLDQSLQNKNLDYFGIFSGSTFANNFSFIWVVIIIAFIHSILFLINKTLKRRCINSQNFVKASKWIYQLFAFSIYFRFILEANQFMILSSFSELKLWNTTSASKIISLWIALITSILWLGLILLSFIYWLRIRKIESTEHYMPLKVFVSGIKDGSKPRLYSTFLLARRAFFVIFLILGSSIPSIGIIVPLMVVQTVYLSLMIIVRPYKSTKDNLLETTNEVFYLVLISLLSYYNSESNWRKSAESTYLFIIIGNSWAIISIMIGRIFYIIINWNFIYVRFI